MEDHRKPFTHLHFRLRREKEMPVGFTIHFRVEVKGLNRWIKVWQEAESESEIMVSHGLYLWNLDGLREADLKVFYDCSESDWEYIKIKIIPDHPFNLLSDMAIAKFLKTCRPDAFVRLGLSNIILWATALSIAYFAILISRRWEHSTEDFFEKTKILFQSLHSKHMTLILIFFVILFVYWFIFAKKSYELISSTFSIVLVYYFVFKAIKDLSRIFFKDLTSDLHTTVINSKFKITMLDAASCLVSIFMICIWIDKGEYVNNLIIVCIAIEVAKLFRINSYLLGVKVMLFNLIIDIFWSLSSQYIYPGFINLSHNSWLSTGFLKLEIPILFDDDRSYYC